MRIRHSPSGSGRFEPGEFGVALQGVERAVDVVDLARQITVGVVDAVALVLAASSDSW